MTIPLDIRETRSTPVKRAFSSGRETASWIDTLLARLSSLGSEQGRLPAHRVLRYPQRFTQTEFYSTAYPLMFLSRHLDERMDELFKKGYAKGTVTTGIGNEATAVGMIMPLRPGRDVVSIMHRDAVGH